MDNDVTIFIASTAERGRGVFTSVALEAGAVVETAPVIVMSKEERVLLDQTLLHDYIFEWDDGHQSCCMALGFVPIYNHSYESNCTYEMDYDRREISIITVRSIEAGEELCINYNGEWNDRKSVWFDVK